MIEEETDSDDLRGTLIDESDLAEAVGADMASDDPVVRALWDDLIRGEHAKAVMAEAQMRQVIEFNQRLQGQHRFQEGMGQLVARIPLSVYLHWTAVHGHDFWNESDSLDFLAHRAGGGRGNPGLLIETKGRPTIIKPEFGTPKPDTPSAVAGRAGVHNGVSSAAGTAPAVPAASAPVRGKRGRWKA